MKRPAVRFHPGRLRDRLMVSPDESEEPSPVTHLVSQGVTRGQALCHSTVTECLSPCHTCPLVAPSDLLRGSGDAVGYILPQMGQQAEVSVQGLGQGGDAVI